APQLFFFYVPLDCDTRNVAGVLNQLQFRDTGTAWFTVVDRKSAESLAFAREQRARPNGANSIRQHAPSIQIPGGGGQNIGYIHRLPAKNRSTAGSTFRTNGHSSHLRDKSRETRRSGTVQFLCVLIRKPDRAGHAFGLRFNQFGDVGENFGQTRASKDQLL